jgi:ribosome maturation factor RimP
LFWKEVHDMGEDLKTQVADVVRPVLEAEGLELFDVEIAGAAHAPVVRVYADKQGGVVLDEISEATRHVSAALDEADVPSGRYTLEVSSPGIDRPLRDLDDVDAYVGENAQFTLSEAVDGRKRFTGVITGVEGGSVVLDVEGAGAVTLPWSSVTKARLKVHIDIAASARDNRISEERTADDEF